MEPQQGTFILLPGTVTRGHPLLVDYEYPFDRIRDQTAVVGLLEAMTAIWRSIGTSVFPDTLALATSRRLDLGGNLANPIDDASQGQLGGKCRFLTMWPKIGKRPLGQEQSSPNFFLIQCRKGAGGIELLGGHRGISVDPLYLWDQLPCKWLDAAASTTLLGQLQLQFLSGGYSFSLYQQASVTPFGPLQFEQAELLMLQMWQQKKPLNLPATPLLI